MSDPHRSRLGGLLHSVTLGLERALAEEAATGAVQGASEGLRQELEGVASGAREWLEGVATRAAQAAMDEMRASDGAAAVAASTVAAAATRGALDELQRQWAEGGLPMHAVAQRIDALLDDARRVALARERLSDVADRAREIAANAVDGALGEIRSALRDGAAAASASRAAHDVGYSFGRGLAEGLGADGERRVRALSAAAVRGMADGAATSAHRYAQGSSIARAVATATGAAAEGVVSVLRRALARPSSALGLVAVLALLARRR